MPTPSARLGIPNYTESDTPVDIPAAWIARTAILDTLVPIASSNLAARPPSASGTPGIVGRQAIVTGEQDSPRLDLDLGTSWITVGPPMKDGPPDVPSSRTLGVGSNQAAPGNSTSLFSPGDLKPSAANTPQPGWLLCDGSAVDRAQYAALWQAIGSAFGAGDGSTTFNLPDYRGRVIVGAGTGTASGATAHALGQMSGEERHALAIGEVPSHSHTGQTSSENVNHSHNVNGGTSWNDRDHTHGLSGHVATTGGGYWGQGWSAASNVGGPAAAVTLGGGWPGDSTGTGGASTPHAHTFNVQSGIENTPHVHWITAEGGNGSHNNMQPYAVANVFIKT